MKLWQSLSWVTRGEYSGMLSSHIPGEASLLALLTRMLIATIGATSSVSAARIGGQGWLESNLYLRVRRAQASCIAPTLCAARWLLSVALIANDDDETDSFVLF